MQRTTVLRTVVSSQSQGTKTLKLEDLITKPLSSNVCLHGASLAVLFQLSGIMSNVTCMFTWYCNS
jgi:hypothetical protein